MVHNSENCAQRADAPLAIRDQLLCKYCSQREEEAKSNLFFFFVNYIINHTVIHTHTQIHIYIYKQKNAKKRERSQIWNGTY
jgi:hypothetical protein